MSLHFRSPDRPIYDARDFRDDVQRGSFYVNPSDEAWRGDALWVGMTEADLLDGRACVWPKALTPKLEGPAWVHRILISDRVDFRSEPRLLRFNNLVEIQSEARFTCGCRSLRTRAVTADECMKSHEDGEPRGFLVRTYLADSCRFHGDMTEARKVIKRKIEEDHLRGFVLALWLTAPEKVRDAHSDFSVADVELALEVGDMLIRTRQLPPFDSENFSGDEIAEWGAAK